MFISKTFNDGAVLLSVLCPKGESDLNDQFLTYLTSWKIEVIQSSKNNDFLLLFRVPCTFSHNNARPRALATGTLFVSVTST